MVIFSCSNVVVRTPKAEMKPVLKIHNTDRNLDDTPLFFKAFRIKQSYFQSSMSIANNLRTRLHVYKETS